MLQRSWLFLLSAASLMATIISVPEDVPTIQGGLNIANEGDTVLVTSGIYYENLAWPNIHAIVLIGSGTDNCIIDGDSLARVITISHLLNEHTVIEGLTLRNGLDCMGGGILSQFGNPTLRNLVIENNLAVDFGNCEGLRGYGGGVFIESGSPRMSNLIIQNNHAEIAGGGIACSDSTQLQMDSTIVRNNSASDFAGGFYSTSSHTEMYECIVTGNAVMGDGDDPSNASGGGMICSNGSMVISYTTIADNVVHLSDPGLRVGGGGVMSYSSDLTLSYCTIANNLILGAPDSMAHLVGGIALSVGSDVSLAGSIVWGNSYIQVGFHSQFAGLCELSINWCDIQEGLHGIESHYEYGENVVFWGAGNMDQNPLFCDPLNQVYTLSESSPCVDADPIFSQIGALGVGCIDPVNLKSTLGKRPDRFFLHQNCPNPFNPTTTISYNLPELSEVTLTIYDIVGREVMTLQSQDQPTGNYEVQWKGVDESGNPVNTGVYFARLQAGDFTKTIKMVYLK